MDWAKDALKFAVVGRSWMVGRLSYRRTRAASPLTLTLRDPTRKSVKCMVAPLRTKAEVVIQGVRCAAYTVRC